MHGIIVCLVMTVVTINPTGLRNIMQAKNCVRMAFLAESRDCHQGVMIRRNRFEALVMRMAPLALQRAKMFIAGRRIAAPVICLGMAYLANSHGTRF